MTARVGGPTRVFVDTSAFFALLDRRDSRHENAVAILQRLSSGRSQLVTTNVVLLETHALLLTRVGRSEALRFLDSIDTGSVQVLRVSAADESEARAILRQYDDKYFSLADATSFAVMRRSQISQ